MKKLLAKIVVITALYLPVICNAQTMFINTVAGNGTDGFSGDGGPATAAQLFKPSDVAADPAGNLYIADYRNHRIRRVDAATGIINTISGTGSPSFSGDGGPATAAGLSYPAEVKLDAAGNIYVTDMVNHRIRKIDAASGIITTIVGGGSSAYYNGMTATDLDAAFTPAGLAVDVAANCYFMYFMSEPRILRYDASDGRLGAIVDSAGISGFSGDGGPALDAKLDNLNYYPGISTALDAANNVYLTDINNFRVRKVDNSTGIITTIAGNGSSGSSGDGGPATAAALGFNFRITVDNIGNVYFFTTQGIHKVDAATQVITRIAGGGTSFAEGIPATAARIYDPHGIATDAAQNIYYADYNGRVRKLTPGCSAVSAGAISSSAGNSFCDSAHTTLSLPGASSGPDIAYQWKSSADGVTWVNAGSGSTSYTPPGIYATTYFKAIVSCTTAGLADSTAIDTITILPPSACVSGIASILPAAALHVYPNPNTGSFIVEFLSATPGNVAISVMNVMGECVKTCTTVTNKKTDLQMNVPAGLYLLRAESTQNRMTTMIRISR